MDTWCIWNLTGGTNGGLHITDVTNASRTMLMDLETLAWDEDIAVDDRRADVDAARDQGLERGLRRGRDRQPDRHPGRRRPRRPAGGHVRPGVLRRRRCQEHVRHRQLHAAQHEHRGRAVEGRPADHGLLQDRRRGGGLRARGLDRDHRGARAVAARQPEDDQGRPEVEELAKSVDDNGGLYIVPAFSRPVRAVLEVRRPRRVRRPDPVRQRRPHRPRHARGDRVPDPRGDGRDGGRLGRHAERAQGRRRHGSATIC